MKGLLVYPEIEIKRNEFIINKFISSLDIELTTPDNLICADFVINRTNDYKIAEYYEKQGIRVFNPSSLSKLANDKQICYEFMTKNNVEIMPINYDKTPVVKKPIDGHGGINVQMLDKLEQFEIGYVYQKPSNNLGKDLRVWLIGDEIITSILRTSNSDFRSNFCLGGKADIYSLTNEEKNLVMRVKSLIKSDYIGIDFIFNDNHIVFNEIEDTVGARMVYDQTDIDIVDMYCQYIKEQLC